LLHRFSREEHLFPQQKVVGPGFFLRASTRPFRSPYCSGATLRVRLRDALFFFTSPRLTGSTLPSHLRSTSLWLVFRLSLKVRWFRLTLFRSRILLAVMVSCLHLKALDLISRDLTSSPKRIFFFGSPCTLRDFITVTSSLHFDVTSFLPLRLHVDRGLARHGYPSVPTDQGPRGPYQVDLTCKKPGRPANGSGDLTHGSGDLRRPSATLSRSRETC
jgi:hypothetical protein